MLIQPNNSLLPRESFRVVQNHMIQLCGSGEPCLNELLTMQKYTYILLLFTLLFASCHRERNQALFARLQQWDAVVEEQPRAIHDSLFQLNPKELSRANRAYWGLLKTIADDKTFVEFTSDSLINSVHSYYHRHDAQNENHIRSLTYLSVVRYRMGITDSTAFAPLKEAEQRYLKQKNISPVTGYMVYYYLGELLSNNGEYDAADTHFHRTLQLTKQKNDTSHIFGSYIALYWNKMVQETPQNYKVGKVYLDSAQRYSDGSPDKQMTLFNAQSTYYDTQGDSENSLEYTKSQLALVPSLQETPQLFRLYYSLSHAYADNHQPDSAMYYARLATEHIEDSTYKLNYLLYENVAEIAEQQNNLPLAIEYRKKALESYEKGVDARLDIQIRELEKRYNFAEVENKALKAQARVRLFIGIVVLLLMALVLVIFNWNRRRKIAALEKANTLSKLQLAQQQATENRRVIHIVLPYLNLHSGLQQELLAFSNKIRAKDGGTADKYEQLLKNNRRHFDTITQQLFTDELLGETLKTTRGLELLNQTDRMLLFMLAIGTENNHIAALLNTTPANLKSKKSYLKKKLQGSADKFDDPDFLLSLF